MQEQQVYVGIQNTVSTTKVNGKQLWYGYILARYLDIEVHKYYTG